MKELKRSLTTAFLICLVSQATIAMPQGNPSKAAGPPSNAKIAFEKLKTLSGTWQGEIMHIPITFDIRAASSGTAIIYEGNTEGGGPPNHEITMFYLDGQHLYSTHYCDAGNRSRCDGKLSPDGNSIKFRFLDLSGSKRRGYLKDMLFTIVDESHHVLEVSFVTPTGKTIPLRGEFSRTK